jgi:uncharacterized protein YbjT (DUF2867 family)
VSDHLAGETSVSDTRTALVLGATGLVGGELVDLLLPDPGWSRVTTLVRRPGHAPHPRLDERVVDLEKMSDHAAAFAADVVFCALGTTIRQAGSQDAFRHVDHDLVVEGARLAAAQGARHFVLVTALDADPASRIFYNRVKGETERDVRALGLPAVTILRPSLILGARSQRRVAERVAQWIAPVLAPLLQGPLRGYRAIPARSVARAMARLGREAASGARVVENETIAALAG